MTVEPTSSLADLRMDTFLDALCQEAERIQFSEVTTAELLWDAARRLEGVQQDVRLLARSVDA